MNLEQMREIQNAVLQPANALQGWTAYEKFVNTFTPYMVGRLLDFVEKIDILYQPDWFIDLNPRHYPADMLQAAEARKALEK